MVTDMTQLTPSVLIISYGADVKMYTLRVTYQERRWTRGEGGESVSYIHFGNDYITNLSTDPDKAIEKAKVRAAEYGFQLDISGARMTLDEIVRRNSEEEAANKKALEAAYFEEERLKAIEIEKYNTVKITEGLFFKGKYAGSTPREVFDLDPSYVEWASKNMDSVHQKIIELADVLPKYTNEFVGEEGDTIEITVTLMNAFWTSGMYPTLMNKCVDADGNRINFFSQAKWVKELEDGDTFTIKGTIKEHSTYCGENSTIIGRPNLVKGE